MKIQLFANKKGIIWGGDPKRIECDKSGTLKIGTAEIAVEAGKNCIMPPLYYGATGNYDATFTTAGVEYVLERVSVRNGLILPPSSTAVELMEIHYLLDDANEKADRLQKKVTELEKIFDTNSLNFIIKPQGE